MRPRKLKNVGFEPGVTYFKPRAVPLNKLKEVIITFDELETLRLSNFEKLSQLDAAKQMDIHQSTFQRTLTRARYKITDALVNGKAIKIHGGDYTTFIEDERKHLRSSSCNNVDLLKSTGINCVCLECGFSQKHKMGIPCSSVVCPKCKNPMTRE